MKTKTVGVVALAYLLYALFGCARIATQSDTPIALIASPSPGVFRTVTMSQLGTGTVVRQKTTTPTPTVTSSPIPQTPTSAPLNQTGPWMLLSKGTMYTGPIPYIDPIVTNVDGSAWDLLNIPRPTWAKDEDPAWYYLDPAPSGPYIAARGYLSEYELNCDENAEPKAFDPYEDFLYIIKLPENKPVQKIQLHSLMAKAQEQKENCHLNNGEIPPVIGVTSLQGNGSWSPDHRYLVFTAAPDGPAADLYLFDRQTDTVRRLTTRQNNPEVLGWSPNGQNIIYMGVTRMEEYHSWVSESSGLYSVSLSGTDRFLLKPKYVPGWLEWLSSHELVIKDGLCDPSDFGTEACNVDIVTVDLSTGAYQTLIQDIHNWVHYVTNPNQHLLLFDDLPTEILGNVKSKDTPTPSSNGSGKILAEGIYQYDFQTHSFRSVPLNDRPNYIYWDKTYLAFRYDTNDQESPYTQGSTLIYYEPSRGFRTEKITSSPYTSPDGKWQIGKVGEDTFILNSSLQPVQKISSDWGQWAPDSSAFVQIVPNTEMAETQFIVYLKRNNWKNPYIRHLKEGFDWWGGWITH